MKIILQYFYITGKSPKDQRGKHGNVFHALPSSTKEAIRKHIGSIKGRTSHYSREAKARIYLPSELNVTKLYNMFKEKNPDIKCSYESYRTIFNSEFNIAFGYPRTDTCSTCDSLVAKISYIQTELQACNSNTDTQQTVKLQREFKKLTEEHELHKRKSEVFYSRKREARKKAEKNEDFEAVAFDYQKNLYVPNKTTNDVYYKRQLSCFSFNVHVLSSKESHFYCYDETIARKGSDDVCSMLHHFCLYVLCPNVKEVAFFCDSCCGQNKNWSVMRFFHWLVHNKKRFTKVTITFPIRGHSYLECDKNMALVNTKMPAETPDEWWEVFRASRQKPSPFVVHVLQQSDFSSFSKYFEKRYKKSCPFPVRPVRELWFDGNYPKGIRKRTSWHGLWEQVMLLNKRNYVLPTTIPTLYSARLPISREKYKDLQVLKKFCSPQTAQFFDSLPKEEAEEDENE